MGDWLLQQKWLHGAGRSSDVILRHFLRHFVEVSK